MRNKRVLSLVKKLLSEHEVLSTQEIHEQMIGKRYCPTMGHLATILTSLPWVEVEGRDNKNRTNLWRLKDETPTDN